MKRPTLTAATPRNLRREARDRLDEICARSLEWPIERGFATYTRLLDELAGSDRELYEMAMRLIEEDRKYRLSLTKDEWRREAAKRNQRIERLRVSLGLDDPTSGERVPKRRTPSSRTGRKAR
jgi:hypothetical protein